MENEWIVQVGMKAGAYRKQRTRNARPLLAVCTRITVGATTGRPQQIKPYRSFSILNSDSLRAAYGGFSLDAHCGGCLHSPFAKNKKGESTTLSP